MAVLEKALTMLEKHPLCDHCLGRQFALLGYGKEDDERGAAIKLALTMEAHAASLTQNEEGVAALKTLAINGFSEAAHEVLRKMRKRLPEKRSPKVCFLCEDGFTRINSLAQKALSLLEAYEYATFLVGVELPLPVEEREDEFRALFDVNNAESMRNEFGRLVGKKLAESIRKPVDFLRPDIAVIINPYTEAATLQINPLFVAGRYKKLLRGIPQSKWFCSDCHGKGCKECGWTGKMYAESVEEIVSMPLLEETGGTRSSFHASGREDIDARMLGPGRPFVIEITRPKKRSLDLGKLEGAINIPNKGKVQVSGLRLADRDSVRKLKRGENAQKKYRVLVGFQNRITEKEARLIEKRLRKTTVVQKTPTRVLHRRADLTRERYIYDVNVKKVSPKKAELRILCQGGLYVKELVTGDQGRTTPNISAILQNRAEPLKLDVLDVIIGD